VYEAAGQPVLRSGSDAVIPGGQLRERIKENLP